MSGNKFMAALIIWSLLSIAPVLVRAADDAAVTVQEDQSTFTLNNGVITVRILKRNGDIRSLQYKGTETLTDRSGHAGGYWSHDTTGGTGLVTKVTIDPAMNGGERAEVSVKGISGGRKMGHGPGAAADGDFPADIEIRYALGRGDSGVYTYCIFDHLPEYDSATMTEARFAVKLADFFDWMSIDEHRNKHYPETLPGEDKYVDTALQSENRAFGFSSTTRKIGFYFINPTIEYLSGGPTKPEFLCHRDTTRVQAPVVLNYWRSSHYGGADVSVEKGESWTRVVGPFMLYVNEGPDPVAMWRDARGKADAEAGKWPYAWVAANGYATPKQRSTVTGRLVLNDPLLTEFPSKFMVGLAHPPYTIGESKHGKDWFFAHVPHNIDPDARVVPFRGVTAKGRATPYTIRFQMEDKPSGSAVLRLAICGTGTRSIGVSVNGKPVGQIALGPDEGVITRHQVQGLWYEREFQFDASLLLTGKNTMTLTVPEGSVNAGVVYDYLRLELVGE